MAQKAIPLPRRRRNHTAEILIGLAAAVVLAAAGAVLSWRARAPRVPEESARLLDDTRPEPSGAADRIMLIPNEPAAEPANALVATAVAPMPSVPPAPPSPPAVLTPLPETKTEVAAEPQPEIVRKLKPSAFKRPFDSVAPSWTGSIAPATSPRESSRSTPARSHPAQPE
jgi:hypothetical protein